MKTVRLPIYEDGLETMAYMEIDVRHFLGAGGSEIAHNYIRIMQAPTAEQEKEMIDRIISGLPTRPFFEDFDIDANQCQYYSTDRTIDSYIEQSVQEKQASAHYRLHEDGRVETLVKQENLEWGPPQPRHVDGWREIPGFSRYEMSPYKAIAESATGKSVSIVKGGRIDNVLLSNDDGITKRMSVDFLFKKTYPELP